MATTTSPMPAPDAPASISPIGRIIGALFSPKKTFADIARKPSWLAPVLVLTILSAVVCFGINQRIDWREYIRHQMEQSSSADQLSPEQKQQRIEAGAKFAPIATYAFGVPAVTVVILIVAGVMLGAYNLLAGAGLNYRTSLGLVSHAYVPAFVSSLLFILILYMKPFGTVDLENPIAANLAAFLPEGSSKALVKLGTYIDVFSFWILFLLGVGFAAANPKKLSFGKSLGIAVSVYAVFVVIRVAWVFIFS
jgi:hypothetical protein